MNYRLPTTGAGAYLYQRSPTHKHRGIDLSAPVGTPIHAADGGVVEHAINAWEQGFTGYGRVVVIRSDDGRHELYAHLERATVAPGQRVARGTVIGLCGTSQFSREDHHLEGRMGAHLHFEVSARAYPMLPEAERTDPIAWFAADRGRVHPITAKPPSSAGSPPPLPPAEGTPEAAPPLAGSRGSLVSCPSCGSRLELAEVNA